MVKTSVPVCVDGKKRKRTVWPGVKEIIPVPETCTRSVVRVAVWRNFERKTGVVLMTGYPFRMFAASAKETEKE